MSLSRTKYRLRKYQYKQAKRKAINKRNIVFNMSFEHFCYLKSQKHCFYTGIKMTNNNDKEQILVKNTIDRINSKKGYTNQNTVGCCYAINQIKNAWEKNKEIVTPFMLLKFSFKVWVLSFTQKIYFFK